jgi:hypothetical protein
MTGKVIQGSFLGGQRKLPSPAPARVPPPIQAKTAVRPPGPPTPAFAGRPGTVQPHAAVGAFAVEAGQLGLASVGGRPLPDAVRGKMEAALRADFSNVRVHVGPQAERIGAIAFTIGSDIYFAPGRFQPDMTHGQQLLGHELAHVVQQRAGRVRNPLRDKQPGVRPFRVASKSVSRGEVGANERNSRLDIARLFEPQDCLVEARLQQMRLSDPEIPQSDRGIAGAEADRLLLCRNRLIDRADKDLASAEIS